MALSYEQHVREEVRSWQKQITRKASLMGKLSRRMQQKINSYIPEKVHRAITVTIRGMIRGVLFGATHTTKQARQGRNLEETERAVLDLIKNYKHTAAAEGGVTGAGGFLLGLADFPILLGIKMKMLFDVASLYGFDTRDYKERIYILHIFQLAFSSQDHRRAVFIQMNDWEHQKHLLPDDINQFDWRNFQQEYRDYIDLAKMAQLIPGIGAVVGVIVNYKLIRQLGETAMNAYRMRLIAA